MIERANPKLSITRQCRILSISRSSFYYATKGEIHQTLEIEGICRNCADD
jgi:putative transposase